MQLNDPVTLNACKSIKNYNTCHCLKMHVLFCIFIGFILSPNTTEDPWSSMAITGCGERFGGHAPSILQNQRCRVFLD
jgi:hypothetical protein